MIIKELLSISEPKGTNLSSQQHGRGHIDSTEVCKMKADNDGRVSKRQATKSKFGCNNCKKRKVKCDESFPICNRCLKREEDCIYSNIRPPAAEDAETMYAAHGTGDMMHPVRCSAIAKDQIAEEYQRNIERDAKAMAFLPESFAASIVIDDQRQIRLPSHEDNSKFPSYLSHTVINNKAMLYYTKVFYGRISPIMAYSKPWGEIPHFSYQYIHIYHIMLSVLFTSMYHDAINGRVNFLDLPNLEDYLVLARLNYNAFKREFSLSQQKPKTETQHLVADMVSSMLELMIFMFSPSYTVADPVFIKKALELKIHTNHIMPLLRAICPISDGIPLDYYAVATPPKMSVEHNVYSHYFPEYLFQLVDIHGISQGKKVAPELDIIGSKFYEISRNGDTSSSSSSADDLDGSVSPSDSSISDGKDAESPDTLDSEDSDKGLYKNDYTYDEAIYSAVEMLKYEFAYLYNSDSNRERDIFKKFLRWPMMLDVKFGVLLSKQDSRALIVMAHYVMFLKCCSSLDSDMFNPTLFSPSVFIHEIQNIDSVIGDEYRGWLDLPKRVVGGDLKVVNT